MTTLKYAYIISFICFSSFLQAQKKFKVIAAETKKWREIYSLIDERGKLIKQLDSAKYYINFTRDIYQYFAVFGIKGAQQSGWAAIDSNEKILFYVYNTSYGEPTPDDLIENKIRIVDKNDKIGFADNRGKIIIDPQFEIATSFHNGKAIIGEKCEKIPWDKHVKEGDCHHYSIQCEKYGYVNKKGKIIQLGNYTFEEVMNKINWKAPEYY